MGDCRVTMKTIGKLPDNWSQISQLCFLVAMIKLVSCATWYGHSQRYGGRAKQSHEFILKLIYFWTPDFKNPNTVATVPDHQSIKTNWNCDCDRFWFLKLL